MILNHRVGSNVSTITLRPRRRNLWVTDTLQWRRKPGSLSPRTCAGFSSLLFVASCLLNQLLPPVNAPSDRADPGKYQQRRYAAVGARRLRRQGKLNSARADRIMQNVAVIPNARSVHTKKKASLELPISPPITP